MKKDTRRDLIGGESYSDQQEPRIPDVVIVSVLVAFTNGSQRAITYNLGWKKEAGEWDRE